MKNLQAQNIELENEANTATSKLDKVESQCDQRVYDLWQEYETRIAEMTESFSGQIDTLKREADKYNKKTTEEWESQIESLTKQREEEKT